MELQKRNKKFQLLRNIDMINNLFTRTLYLDISEHTVDGLQN